MNSATDPNRIKAETISPPTKVQAGKRKPGRPSAAGPAAKKNKTMPPRKMTMVKSEQELIVPAITEDDVDDIDEYNDDNITYDNYGSDYDDGSSESQNLLNIEPVVELNLQENSNALPRIIDIKKEKVSDDFSALRSGPLTVDHILKIKREEIAKQQAIKISNLKNPFAVRVKQEAENGYQPAVKVLNPFSNAANNKKVFKFPQGLRMKIKKEKNHKMSVVQIKTENDGTIDEADADSEEEAQMQQMATSIVKMEKVERSKSVIKQFINPMALAMKSNKSNGTEFNSLVISSVSSISEEAVIDNSEKNNADDDEEALSTPACDDKMMTEIPAEFKKSTGGEELQQELEQPSIEDTNTPLPSLITLNNQIDDVLMNNSNDDDELDELLEKYGARDIHDDDIQDLLKFD